MGVGGATMVLVEVAVDAMDDDEDAADGLPYRLPMTAPAGRGGPVGTAGSDDADAVNTIGEELPKYFLPAEKRRPVRPRREAPHCSFSWVTSRDRCGSSDWTTKSRTKLATPARSLAVR